MLGDMLPVINKNYSKSLIQLDQASKMSKTLIIYFNKSIELNELQVEVEEKFETYLEDTSDNLRISNNSSHLWVFKDETILSYTENSTLRKIKNKIGSPECSMAVELSHDLNSYGHFKDFIHEISKNYLVAIESNDGIVYNAKEFIDTFEN